MGPPTVSATTAIRSPAAVHSATTAIRAAAAVHSAAPAMHATAAAVHSTAPAVHSAASAARSAPHLSDEAVVHVGCDAGRSEDFEGVSLRQTETEKRNAKQRMF